MNQALNALFFTFLSSAAFAHQPTIGTYTAKPVLADIRLLKAAGAPILYSDPATGVAYSQLTPAIEQRLSQLAHAEGKCGGFESLESIPDFNLNAAISELAQLNIMQAKVQAYNEVSFREVRLPANPQVVQAVKNLSSANLRSWVEWMSKFPSRFNKATDPNVHVRALVEKLNALGANNPFIKVDLITHKSTKQQSVRVRLEGSTRPSETIVMGAHFDSINQNGGNAPGADDNASGSSNLLEALRVILASPRIERSLEFFWYAGEESGLLGSADVAQSYKREKRDVIAALQLDMTLFPGAGKNKLGFMTDFTSPWLRDYLKGINDTYVGAEVQESECGYGCSDHASWYRQGYPAVIPFEATYDTMNHSIHTANDIINSRLNFDHSLMFSKLALAMALELGNSTERQPF